MANKYYSQKLSWVSNLDRKGLENVIRLNETCSPKDLNNLRDRVSQLRRQLKKARGKEKHSILTNLAECDLEAKKLIHMMLRELILELRRIHHQGYDIAEEMRRAGHPFCSQYYDSLTGYAFNRENLQNLIQEL